MNEPTHQPDSAAEKASLENQKLRAEIATIGKPWRTVSFWFGLPPCLVAIGGIIWTLRSGWFDVQRERNQSENIRLEASKFRLEAENSKLEAQKTKIEMEAQEQQAIVAAAKEENARLRAEGDKLAGKISVLTRERDELSTAKTELEKEAQRLASSDTKAREYLEQLMSIQAERQQLSAMLEEAKTKIKAHDANLTLQANIIRKANEVLFEGWRISLTDKPTWEKFRKFSDDATFVHIISHDYLSNMENDLWMRKILSEKPSTLDDDRKMAAGLDLVPDWDLLQRAKSGAILEGDDLRAFAEVLPGARLDLSNMKFSPNAPIQSRGPLISIEVSNETHSKTLVR